MNRLLVGVALLVAALPASGQEARYELGQRLRAFEAEWARVGDAEARKRAVEPLQKANVAFLTFSDAEAARQLDRARLALSRAGEPEDVLLWAASWAVRPSGRLVDAGGKLDVTLDHSYKPRVDPPRGVRVRLSLCDAAGKPLVRGAPADVPAFPQTESLSLNGAHTGDYLLRAELLQGEKVLAASEQTISVVAGARERLGKLEKAVAALPADDRSVEALTVRDLAQTLRQLADGKTLETNYPAVRLLAEAEAALAAVAAGKTFYTPERAGQFWLRVGVGSASVPVRVQVPEGLRQDRPVPLVVALHGAGGSENLFFDGYANGAVTRLCARRGWLLAATRNAQGLADGLLAELGKRYPVDARKVFLVGHSMGATQSVRLASGKPEQFAAVAALGGGGPVTPSDGLKKVAFLVSCGREDFMLPISRGLAAGLKRAGVEKLVVREYPDVEHLAVVQLALPEVFALFDEVTRK
jgi:predicted esterase